MGDESYLLHVNAGKSWKNEGIRFWKSGGNPAVCVGLWDLTLCTTSWVQDYIVHHQSALCITDLYHGAQGGPMSVRTQCSSLPTYTLVVHNVALYRLGGAQHDFCMFVINLFLMVYNAVLSVSVGVWVCCWSMYLCPSIMAKGLWGKRTEDYRMWEVAPMPLAFSLLLYDHFSYLTKAESPFFPAVFMEVLPLKAEQLLLYSLI